MEGLIPFLYKTVIGRYKNSEDLPSIRFIFSDESPSASYMRLSGGDSGRHMISEVQIFPPSPRALPPPGAQQRPLAAMPAAAKPAA